MKWGETYEQEKERLESWQRAYALWPTSMSDGTWVWLEYYELRLIRDGYWIDEWEKRAL